MVFRAILRPFKEYIEKKGLKKGDQVVYHGVPGTCTPFVELLGLPYARWNSNRSLFHG